MKVGRSGLISEPHEIMACYGSPAHCVIHNADELPMSVYRACIECNHAFASEQELIDAHSQLMQSIFNPSELEHMVPVRIEAIFSCPYCTHDW